MCDRSKLHVAVFHFKSVFSVLLKHSFSLLQRMYFFQSFLVTKRGRYRSYSPSQLTNACLDVVMKKSSVSKAAKIYAVPIQTIRNRLKHSWANPPWRTKGRGCIPCLLKCHPYEPGLVFVAFCCLFPSKLLRIAMALWAIRNMYVTDVTTKRTWVKTNEFFIFMFEIL